MTAWCLCKLHQFRWFDTFTDHSKRTAYLSIFFCLKNYCTNLLLIWGSIGHSQLIDFGIHCCIFVLLYRWLVGLKITRILLLIRIDLCWFLLYHLEVANYFLLGQGISSLTGFLSLDKAVTQNHLSLVQYYNSMHIFNMHDFISFVLLA